MINFEAARNWFSQNVFLLVYAAFMGGLFLSGSFGGGSYSSSWHTSSEDKTFDGAVRTAAWASRQERTISLRCFKSNSEATGSLDLRYEINVPLLGRVVPDLEKAGEIALTVSIDGVAIGSLKARAIKHDFGMSFLADLEPAMLDKFGSAEHKVVVMPRQNDASLDEIIEFGVKGLTNNIEPVKTACQRTIQEIDILHRSAANGDGEAMFKLGDLYSQPYSSLPFNQSKAASWFLKSAEAGYVPAMPRIAKMLAEGSGILKNEQAAHLWYEKAAARDDLDVMSTLASQYYWGKEFVDRDVGRAFELAEKAAANGYAPAMALLGMIYEDDTAGRLNLAKALEWYEKAATRQFRFAAVRLGHMYRAGRGVDKDYGKASIRYEKAVEIKKDGEAASKLGEMYAHGGPGLPQDFEKAREWFEKADEDDAYALASLGWLYQTGSGVAADYAKAKGYYEKVASLGVSDGDFRLGQLVYAGGPNLPKDEVAGVALSEKAARAGDSDAMLWLGLTYSLRALKRDDAKGAFAWLQKASAAGNVKAYSDLADAYRRGLGTKRDGDKAREWYQKAADAGDANAKRALDELAIEQAEARCDWGESARLAAALKTATNPSEVKKDKDQGSNEASALGNVSWRLLRAKDFSRALEAAEQALALSPGELWIQMNKAHALLFLGRRSEAEAIYFAHVRQQVFDDQYAQWEDVIARDFFSLRKAGMDNAAMTEIENQLASRQCLAHVEKLASKPPL
ncbi:MAG: tetratricopeptide repeat protein [Rhodomicrobium sp.]